MIEIFLLLIGAALGFFGSLMAEGDVAVTLMRCAAYALVGFSGAIFFLSSAIKNAVRKLPESERGVMGLLNVALNGEADRLKLFIACVLICFLFVVAGVGVGALFFVFVASR
ncbi:hypothetical protein [Variovorax sp. KK3]|uniref:hypothetical protein n=1 Tax=Variovorax sp. KK3 TaxID=1855728 RepID=UPI00117C416B|nr:hypothetical protein [Variovorax sp. KK3]